MKKPLLNASVKRFIKPFSYPILLLVLIIFLKTIIVDFSYVSGYSMSPTLRNGQPLLIVRCAYGLRKPRNIYEIPFLGNLSYYLSDESKVDSILKIDKSFEYIHARLPKKGDIVALNIPGCNHYQAVKRCVALPGDSMPYFTKSIPYDIVPYRGMVIRAQSLNDSQYKYLEQNRDFILNDSDSTFVALDDFIYVVGDNSDVSEDSRKWGPVAMNLIYGRVFHIDY